MNILAIEPYYSGSHKAYLDGWQKRSRHNIELITYPGYKWKWRMRHSSLSAARETATLLKAGRKFDLIFASDMLNLAEYCGLAPAEIAALPRIAYFHENQLTYPESGKYRRDMHFVYSNFLSAAATGNVWFNSGWHRDNFLSALKVFLKRMPDFRHIDEVESVEKHAAVFPQAVTLPENETLIKDTSDTITITWAARWEHDKNPEDLYKLLQLLSKTDLKFRINIIGETFNQSPPVFQTIKDEFSTCINRYGYQPTREDYEAALTETDIIISTAVHEFFGISVVEGCAFKAIPLAPARLAYPEVLEENTSFLYQETAEDLAAGIIRLSRLKGSPEWISLQQTARKIAEQYSWKNVVAAMDNKVEEICRCQR